jgi:ribosomal protein L11 methyltransferase
MLQLVAQVCWELDSSGMIEEPVGRTTRIKAYFPQSRGSADLEDRFLDLARRRSLPLDQVKSASVLDDTEAWLAKWKQNFSSFAVTETIYIHPSWEPPSPRHSVNLVLEPGHAFGSGTHESTQLALRALESEAVSAKRLLDVGTGSGILSIAACKLNPALCAIAFDSEQQAVDDAQQNVFRNHVQNIHLFAGTIDAVNQPSDLVVANLTLAIFQQIGNQLLGLTAGRLLLSGFTDDQEAAVLHAVDPNLSKFSDTRRWTLNGWVCCQLTVDR